MGQALCFTAPLKYTVVLHAGIYQVFPHACRSLSSTSSSMGLLLKEELCFLMSEKSPDMLAFCVLSFFLVLSLLPSPLFIVFLSPEGLWVNLFSLLEERMRITWCSALGPADTQSHPQLGLLLFIRRYCLKGWPC